MREGRWGRDKYVTKVEVRNNNCKTFTKAESEQH